MKVSISNYRRNGNPQKVNILIDRWDTISADYTLARIILPILIQVKDRKVGVPGEFITGVGSDYDDQYYFDFINDDKDQLYEYGKKKWNEILDKMIWSFQQLVDEEWDRKYYHGKAEFDWEPITYTDPITNTITNGYKLKSGPNSTHWYDTVGHKLHYQRIQEGLELFGKYMTYLWD